MADSQWSRRDFFKRSAAVGAVAIGGSAALSACGGNGGGGGGGGAGAGSGALDTYRSNGITIGIANENPYGFKDKSGKITGEAPEVARVVLKNLGITKLNFRIVSFDALIQNLNARRFDLIAAGMFINPDRCNAILFSDPDYCALEALAVKKGNPLGLSDYQSVKNNPKARIAVENGAVEAGYVEDIGVPSSRIQKVDSNQALVQSVLSGRADAFTLTSFTVSTLIKGQSGLEMAKPFVPVINGKEQFGCGGYGFRKDQQDFRNAFNDELHKLQDQNKVLPIIQPFGFDKASVDEAKKHTAQQLCSAS